MRSYEPGEASLYEELGVDSSASEKEIKPLGEYKKAVDVPLVYGILGELQGYLVLSLYIYIYV